jgi:predicted tellurium resistance membrane protein TerC
MKGGKVEDQPRNQASGWTSMLLQMSLINIIFSLDSVITAVGMADHLWVMIAAVVVSMLVMLLAATTIADFVNGNPSVKILALAFLVLIGVSLLAEGLEQEINKGYIYFSMAFAFTIEMINLRVDKFNSN